jgi:molybdate transport system regulatory protein
LKKWEHTPPSLATLRIEIGETVRLGPGKVQLLELISAASRTMGLGYRHSWMLIATLNRAFREPVVVAQPGGRPDQRVAITAFGHEVVRAEVAARQRAGLA